MTKFFEGMRKYLSFLDKMSKNNLLNIGLGDWYDIGPKEPWGSQLTPVAFTATAIYYYDYYLMAKMARVLNKNIEADKFEIKALQIKNAFNNEFYNSAEKSYATGSNTCMAMPLFLGMAPSQDRQSIIDTLVADIRNRDNSFTSGDVGYRFLLKTLAMAGRSDVIFDMNNQSDKPGYGYQLKMGATSLTEKWDASVGSFGSQNHFMLGQINEWFFHDLAGIGWDEDGPGFCKSIIKPSVIGDIKWVKASYKTVSGLIAVAWEKQNHQFILNITIPANTSATVYVPTVRKSNVTESGKQPTDTEEVKYLKMENGCAVYKVSSGNYHFESVIE